MRRLQNEGLVQSVARLQLRGGKSAGVNLAARMAHGDIFIVIDCDCSFEPDAIEELLRPSPKSVRRRRVRQYSRAELA